MAHVVAIGTLVTADKDGNRIRLQEGTMWEANDPFVKHRPDLFRLLDGEKRAPVEQASATPGEKRRGPGRPPKPKPAQS